MDKTANILILSCGTRNKIVQYFKRELDGKGLVIATDCSNLAPALYEADKHYIVPMITDPSYLETILKICKDNNVTGILSLIDPELSILSKNRELFLDIGVTPIVSDYDVVEMCFDKYEFYQNLKKNNINTVKSYINLADFYKDYEKNLIKFPVFVKPVKGSASININLVNSKEEIELLFSRFDDLIIQEYMIGKEYGADVYIDMISNETVSIFTKEKIKMRAGETDKSVSVKDEKLFNLILELTSKINFKGIIDIDIFERGGDYFISEVNPRFGGGYPHAYESGVNVPLKIYNNIRNLSNDTVIGEYEKNKVMMKFNEVMIIDNIEV